MMPSSGIPRSGPGSRCSKCRRYCRTATTFLFSHIGLCSLVVGYSIVGAFTFEALEAGYEAKKRESMLRERKNVVNDLWNITYSSVFLSEANWSQKASQTLLEFEVTLVKAVRKEGYDGKEESPLQWTFSGALLYSIIVITTIGYGNIAPKTPWGKIVTIFYAIIGIPLLLLCLSNIGDAMAHSFRFIYWKVCCYFCIRPKKRRKKQKPLITYRLPVIRPCVTTNISKPIPLCRDSPNESSTSTFYTAQAASDGSTSSPALTSPPSSPIASQSPASFCNASAIPDYLPETNEALVNKQQAKTLHHQQVPSGMNRSFTLDMDLVPVITNKYALQSGNEVSSNMQLRAVKEIPSRNATVFTISSNHSIRDCNFSAPLKSSNGVIWKHDPPHLDIDPDERVDLTPEPEEEVDVPMWLCLALVVSYICGGAVLFTFWEKWNFLDSSYFCFVTLTTIGFGDLVPGTAVISDDNQLTLGLCSLYLLFGMALLAMSFNLVQEEVTRSVRCIGQRIGIVSDDEDD